jgi:hypothetical protein
MQPTPLKRYRIPGYPTRLEVLAQPELLERHLPPGWRATAEMASLAAMLLAASGCTTTRTLKPSAAAIVAPVFRHGEGRGVMGCEVIAPPMFLSEEEAMQVIAEELSQVGIDVAKRNVAITGVIITPRTESYTQKGGKWERQIREGEAKALEVDILDEEHKVAVEYVSPNDYSVLGGVQSEKSVQDFDLKEVARGLAKEVRRQAKGVRFGILYDPHAKPPKAFSPAPVHREQDPERWKQWWEDLGASARTESKRLLRLQVKDFIDWLKGQGVI